ncbi:type II secretion system protein [Colwellia sp. Arc7-635]|jgi:MSHA pilin protein MshC|uniref:type II secretion system protein n=1 Tax=Colwellia sp. Arc7-635 TaxID=2497879 RepID=UPI000F859A7D|nr:type II secretion system protein [Colwellia sp. Arc7-635]AZQ85766.1 type II secretion system protein [Colwellia sp. Arc7-635]
MISKGFTLIELVVVIVILGILSVTVAPKFFTHNGYSEYAYRTDIIAKLRLIQTRAMQQVNNPFAPNEKYCHQVLLSAKQLSKDICLPVTEYVNQSEQRATSVIVANDDSVTFSSANTRFAFDSMGRPSINGSNRKIEITITGEQALKVIIESEGYIHAS